jgi:hypothetical protein
MISVSSHRESLTLSLEEWDTYPVEIANKRGSNWVTITRVELSYSIGVIKGPKRVTVHIHGWYMGDARKVCECTNTMTHKHFESRTFHDLDDERMPNWVRKLAEDYAPHWW